MISPESLRLALILSGVTLSSISDGFIFGQMSGMVAALASPGGDELHLTPNQLSWIAATINITCVCGFAIASLISDQLGRRRTFTFLTTPVVGVWLMVYYAQDFATLIISRVLVGACFGGVLMNTLSATGEYTPPNVRGMWLNVVNSGGSAVGTTIGHILGFFFNWRTVALLGIIPTAISAVLPCFWVESPPWLAEKGRYEECENAFRALHGNRPGADKELRLLLQVEKMKRKSAKPSLSYDFRKLIQSLKMKYFWNLSLLVSVTSIYRTVGSKILFSTLAITMLQEMTGYSDILLFTLLVDGFLVIGAFLSCYLISKMNMRTLLFTSGILANVFLIALSAYMYFGPKNSDVFPWINCTLLALYFISVNAGPYPVIETLYGEIFPMDIKGSCIFIHGGFCGVIQFVAIKYSSNLFTALGYHGVFFLNAVVMSFCLLYFWVRLPETKGRTLQEIELYFKNNTFDKAEHILSNSEEVKVLL